jgi:hypothetical protein
MRAVPNAWSGFPDHASNERLLAGAPTITAI